MLRLYTMRQTSLLFEFFKKLKCHVFFRKAFLFSLFLVKKRTNPPQLLPKTDLSNSPFGRGLRGG
ncbi:hypothetical protein KsCSTR_23420 [Candidatus Kuenenia stuttgartiensis]|uniref:Uncharacterized protein n=1 Tax=Kuenenia stuttgartiensis TaxID=174633 RepID=Q1Q3M8_KUEST|nr:hypothetical protein KsCSTR_23420 [Candidatus Kuenenia stuttgartiensis]CAJ74610.1 unknown protein [Candidatus Kuenenia stuttgartiensis]